MFSSHCLHTFSELDNFCCRSFLTGPYACHRFFKFNYHPLLESIALSILLEGVGMGDLKVMGTKYYLTTLPYTKALHGCNMALLSSQVYGSVQDKKFPIHPQNL